METTQSSLFHYCSNQKCFSILGGKTLRMSDIQKSNDHQELRLFFPRLLHYIESLYIQQPFPIKYRNLTDVSAMMIMVRESLDYWNRRFLDGEFSDFVVCFSEVPDVLSQWRGYADDGKGCCIGFSKEQLQYYCSAYSEVLRLEKVQYLSAKQIDDQIWSCANGIVSALPSLRTMIMESQHVTDDNPDLDIMIRYQFDRLLEFTFVDSLRYKAEGFSEEKEWRLFLSNPGYKNPDWICRANNTAVPGPSWFEKTIDFLNNKVEFMATDNNLIAYYPIHFSEFKGQVVTQIWMGPKNRILDRDLDLYLRTNGYENLQIFHSRISYC